MDIEGADNKEQILAAHRKTLDTMTTSELAKLLIAMGPQHAEDNCFRELIMDDIKKRKP